MQLIKTAPLMTARESMEFLNKTEPAAKQGSTVSIQNPVPKINPSDLTEYLNMIDRKKARFAGTDTSEQNQAALEKMAWNAIVQFSERSLND